MKPSCASVSPGKSAALGQQWFPGPGITANTFRILSTRDGRPLRFVDGGSVTLGAADETGVAVEWRFTAENNGHGRHYVSHPASSNKRLRLNTNGTYSMVASTDTNDLSKWRFVRPAVSEPLGPPPLTGFAAWVQEKLFSRPSADQLATADPDADGLANLLEYALGAEPLAGSDAGMPVCALSPAGTHLTLTFLRARADLTYEVLASTDLGGWTVIATNPGVVGQDVIVTDPVSINPRRFLRLRVTQ